MLVLLICHVSLIHAITTTEKLCFQTCMVTEPLNKLEKDFFHFIHLWTHFVQVNWKLFFVQYFCPATIQLRTEVRSHVVLHANRCIEVARTLLSTLNSTGLRKWNAKILTILFAIVSINMRRSLVMFVFVEKCHLMLQSIISNVSFIKMMTQQVWLRCFRFITIFLTF